jgi:hypothetical protein
MEQHSLAVADIATIVAEASAKSHQATAKISGARLADIGNEDKATIIRRIRHWTLAGALLPIGATHSGTGRHRRYGSESVYEAALLNRLAEWSLPIGVLKAIATVLRQDRARGEFKALWDEAIAGHSVVFLYAMPWAAPDRGVGDTPEVVIGLLPEASLSRFSKAPGAMLLNLSVIFRDISL